MRFRFAPLLVLAGLAAPLAAGGCSQTISEKETTTRRPDGTVIRDTRTVKERSDGSVVVERDRDIDRD